jgi:hypothetical protein
VKGANTKRILAASKAAKARWRDHRKIHELLNISAMSLWRYSTGRTPWPPGLDAKYEKLTRSHPKEKQRNRKYARKLDRAAVEKAKVKR